MMPVSKSFTYLLLALFGIVGIGALVYFLTQKKEEEIPTPTGKGSLSVYVRDATTNTAISGAKVSVDGSVKYTATDGSVKFTNLSPGTYTVKIEKSGYHSKSGTATVEANKETTVEIKLTSIELPPPSPSAKGSLSVNVKDATTGKAIAGATVSVNGQSGGTDANGNITFKNLTPKTYTVKVSAVGYETYTGSATVTAGDITRIEIKLRYSELIGEIIIHTVWDGPSVAEWNSFSGMALANIEVEAYHDITGQKIASGFTDAYGNFRFKYKFVSKNDVLPLRLITHETVFEPRMTRLLANTYKVVNLYYRDQQTIDVSFKETNILKLKMKYVEFYDSGGFSDFSSEGMKGKFAFPSFAKFEVSTMTGFQITPDNFKYLGRYLFPYVKKYGVETTKGLMGVYRDRFEGYVKDITGSYNRELSRIYIAGTRHPCADKILPGGPEENTISFWLINDMQNLMPLYRYYYGGKYRFTIPFVPCYLNTPFSEGWSVYMYTVAPYGNILFMKLVEIGDFEIPQNVLSYINSSDRKTNLRLDFFNPPMVSFIVSLYKDPGGIKEEIVQLKYPEYFITERIEPTLVSRGRYIVCQKIRR